MHLSETFAYRICLLKTESLNMYTLRIPFCLLIFILLSTYSLLQTPHQPLLCSNGKGISPSIHIPAKYNHASSDHKSQEVHTTKPIESEVRRICNNNKNGSTNETNSNLTKQDLIGGDIV